MPIVRGAVDRDLFIRRYPGAFTDEELEAMFADMLAAVETAASEHRKIALMSISDPSSAMHPKQRSRVAEWTVSVAPQMRAGAAAHAIVVPGAIQRGILTAILWMVEHPIPIRTFSNEADADQWARAQVLGAVSARRAS
jgi:hypothetical protein